MRYKWRAVRPRDAPEGKSEEVEVLLFYVGILHEKEPALPFGMPAKPHCDALALPLFPPEFLAEYDRQAQRCHAH